MPKSALPCGAPATTWVARAVMTASSKAFLVASTASSQPWTCAGVCAKAETELPRAKQARRRGTPDRRLIQETPREARSTFPKRLERVGDGYSGIVAGA